MKAYIIERWDAMSPSPCRMEGHAHARGTIGTWVTVLATGDLKEAGSVLKSASADGPARMTINHLKVKIRP